MYSHISGVFLAPVFCGCVRRLAPTKRRAATVPVLIVLSQHSEVPWESGAHTLYDSSLAVKRELQGELFSVKIKAALVSWSILRQGFPMTGVQLRLDLKVKCTIIVEHEFLPVYRVPHHFAELSQHVVGDYPNTKATRNIHSV